MVDFLKFKKIYFIFSLVLILIGLFSIITSGFVFSIDFVGGGLIEFTGKSNKNIEKRFQAQDGFYFQKNSGGFIIKSPKLTKAKASEIVKEMETGFEVKKKRFEIVGPSITIDNIYKIMMASSLSILAILVYVALSFKSWKYGFAAVAALLHDTFILVGAWSVLGYLYGAEFDMLFMTALLTTMSFSVHDTIVIFDKIQEEEEQGEYSTLKESINWSLNITMMRSLNNSLTIVLMLSALMILGGASIKWFAASLLIGTVLGTYSSPFVATPIYYLLSKKDT